MKRPHPDQFPPKPTPVVIVGEIRDERVEDNGQAIIVEINDGIAENGIWVALHSWGDHTEITKFINRFRGKRLRVTFEEEE